MAEQRFSVPPDPTKTAATQRTSPRTKRAIKHSDVRAAALQEEMAEQRFFRSARSDEDGGKSANIAASGASN